MEINLVCLKKKSTQVKKYRWPGGIGIFIVLIIACGLIGVLLLNFWIIIIHIKSTRSKSMELAEEEIGELCIRYGREREIRRIKMKLLILTGSIPDATKRV